MYYFFIFALWACFKSVTRLHLVVRSSAQLQVGAVIVLSSLRKNVWGTGRRKQRRVYRNVWKRHASTWSSVSFPSFPAERDPKCKANYCNLIYFLGKEPGVFDAVIINDDLEKAYKELKEILDEVSKSRKSLCSFYFKLIRWLVEVFVTSLSPQEIKKVQEAKS